jgi:subtilisin family serine protease
VAGVAALIWAARPGLKNYQVADIIKQSARRDPGGWTPTMGCGVLDAGAALELATSRSDPQWAAAAAAGSSSACSATG